MTRNCDYLGMAEELQFWVYVPSQAAGKFTEDLWAGSAKRAEVQPESKHLSSFTSGWAEILWVFTGREISLHVLHIRHLQK